MPGRNPYEDPESPQRPPMPPPPVPGQPVASPAGAAPTAAPSAPTDYTQTQYRPGVDLELDKRINQYMTTIDSTAGSGRWAGGGRSETEAREQWAQWDRFRDPNCPQDRPFRSERGIPGCFEKPVDTPAGTDPSQYGAGGGGAGGGGGRGGRGGIFDPASAESKTVWDAILGRLQGGSRFTPEVMDALLGSVKSSQEGAARRAGQQAESDMARRGLSRSSLASAAQTQIRTGLEGNVLESKAALAKAKVDADFQDRTQAINDGMNWLNGLRSYWAAQTGNANQREAAMANIELGYKTLAHETNQMRERYAQQLQMLGLGM